MFIGDNLFPQQEAASCKTIYIYSKRQLLATAYLNQETASCYNTYIYQMRQLPAKTYI
jgi:hypothetical protein